ncbi:MAG: hypothetical protein RL242_1270, partial [Pseudomonadota bacterium]
SLLCRDGQPRGLRRQRPGQARAPAIGRHPDLRARPEAPGGANHAGWSAELHGDKRFVHLGSHYFQ